MKRVKTGDRIIIIYDGLLSNNEVFESAVDAGPLEFTVGSGSVLPGFDQAVLGMAENEQKTVTLPPAETYGPKREELVLTVKREAFGEKINPQPGMILGMTIERQGEKFKVPATILKVQGEEVTVDFNHPLAGQDLTYRITVQSISRPAARAAEPAEPGP